MHVIDCHKNANTCFPWVCLLLPRLHSSTGTKRLRNGISWLSSAHHSLAEGSRASTGGRGEFDNFSACSILDPCPCSLLPSSQGQPSQLQPPLPSSHVGTIMQDLPEILTDCLQHQYCPVGGLINLVNLWHIAYQQSSTAGGSGVVIVSTFSWAFFAPAR